MEHARTRRRSTNETGCIDQAHILRNHSAILTRFVSIRQKREKTGADIRWKRERRMFKQFIIHWERKRKVVVVEIQITGARPEPDDTQKC